jgi:hypothetical protein
MIVALEGNGQTRPDPIVANDAIVDEGLRLGPGQPVSVRAIFGAMDVTK